MKIHRKPAKTMYEIGFRLELAKKTHTHKIVKSLMRLK